MAKLTADVPECAHRDVSPEAYKVSFGGEQKPVTVHLCNWPEGHPEFFVDAPRWLQKQVYPGLAIDPEHDCIHCPGRLALQSQDRGTG